MLKIEDLRVESRLKLVNESMENSNELSNVGWIDFMRSQKSLVVTRLENGVAIINNNYDYCLSDESIGYFEKLDDRKFKVGDKIKYKGYKSDDLTIKELDDKYERYIFDNDAYLCYKQEEYYELVDKAQYTFDDLIDSLSRLVKDKISYGFELINDDKEILVYIDGSDSLVIDLSNINGGVKLIESLYKETFVIETEEDMCEINGSAKVTLKNGNSFEVNELEHGYIQNNEQAISFRDRNDFWQTYSLFELKGAKVEQSKV